MFHLVLLAAFSLIWLAVPLHAQSAADLRSSGRQIATEIEAQRSAGTFDAAAQQRAVERLGQLALRFIDLSDRAANLGGGDRAALRAGFEALHAPLDEIYTQNARSLERMARTVMDEDGDLEALYETRPFKESQLVASQALYFLNWLNYYGARLHEGARRKELYEQAQRGFSEFAVGDRRTDLLIESLLGRGLCHLDLGQTEFAIHDLKGVANDAQASAERKGKARLALLDAYVRTGNTTEALRLSEQMLQGGSRGDENVVRFLRTQALLAAVKKKSGAEADRHRRDALALMDQLRRAGPGWEERVTALVQTGIENPERWSAGASGPFAQWQLAKLLVQKGDYKGATPLLEQVVGSTDPQLQRHQPEAHYMLGLAKFQANDYEQAAALLEKAVEKEKPAYGADAAYIRFKSVEALVAADPEGPHAARYEAAIRGYLDAYPDHRSAFEAHFRLGELLQAQRRFADALEAYSAVKGDAAFEMRAQFAMLQCRFELLPAANGSEGTLSRAQLLENIGEGLQAFGQQVADYQKRQPRGDGVPLDPMRAKAAIMKAVHLNLLPGDHDQEVIEALAGFEKTFPEQSELLPQVVRLRLMAYQRLGRFTEAEVEVRTHGGLLLASVGSKGVEELAVGFIREGARRRAGEGDAMNQAAQQVALQLYQQLVAEPEGSERAKLTLARLYENTGELGEARKLYSEILQASESSPAALRGLGRIAEAEGRQADALGYWEQYAGITRPGDAPWYEGKYQVARLTHAVGKKKEACEQLNQLKPAMPGLSDNELRQQLNDLYQQICR